MRKKLILILVILYLIPNANADFLIYPSNTSSIIGDSITFRCASEKSLEPIIYSQWKSNTGTLLGYHQQGVLPGHQGRYSYIKQYPEELNLKINNINLDDDGEYECQMLHPKQGPTRAKAFLNVIVPPLSIYFSAYQDNSVIAIKENDPLNLTCVIPNVKPEPEIVWYLDGKVITENIQKSAYQHFNKTLTITSSLSINPERSQQGNSITCEAIHKETGIKLMSNTTLDVLYPPTDPSVQVIGTPRLVKAGESVSIACHVTGGNPLPDVFWYKGGEKLQSHGVLDARSQKMTNIYSFIASSKDNNAKYECRANNSNSPNSKNAFLSITVNYPPLDVEFFGESKVRQGESIKIQCKSLPSNPAAHISWTLNGRQMQTSTQQQFSTPDGIESSSNFTLHTRDLSVEMHQITIECTASNTEGSASRKNIIKIIVPPKAPRITGLKSGHYFEGDIINVTCTADGGNPFAELSWFIGNKRVNEEHNKVSGLSSISTLTLRMDRSMDKQQLRCEAMNSALTEPLVESEYLSVYYTPKSVAIRPAENNINEFIVGKPARLICSAKSSNPVARISWTFLHENSHGKTEQGDVSLNETSGKDGFNVDNIISFIPTRNDNGINVQCTSSHPEWKKSVNATFPLNILYPPNLLIKNPVTIVVSEGDSFKENLTIRGNPPVASWEWKKDKVSFNHAIGKIFARGSVLSGKQVQSEDAGVFVVTATNSIGSVDVKINLVVEYSARITKISSPVVANPGDTVFLECHTIGEPNTPNMTQWLKNGVAIDSSNRSHNKSILRLNATKISSGEYVCRANNGVGVPTERKTFLLVNSAPKIIHDPRYSKIADVLGGTAKAVCRVHAVPVVEFMWERDEQKIKTNNSKYAFVSTQIDYTTFESSLWIKDISLDDYTKKVRCIARNNYGTDMVSIPILPPTNPDVPQNLSSTNSTRNTISIAWEPQFDGGSKQIFEIKYKIHNEDFVHLVNTTYSNLRLSGLAVAQTYSFEVRSINSRGFVSPWTSPSYFSTLGEDGVNVELIHKNWSISQYVPIILIVAVVFILVHVIVCCFLCNKNKKRKLREKTEMARAAIGDIRQVQMYGALLTNEDKSQRGYDDRLEISEDEHSVRTMIEVSPNGFMQPIEPIMYESEHLLNYQSRNYSMGAHGDNTTYANVPYPEPPNFPHNSNWSISPRSNHGSSQLHLSTFINPNVGVRAGPINFSQIDGDLV
uniref:Nephrin n=1 Tax=Caenorhabditis japonica TaxID=281687 RepID=A0A8R1HP98_CAEJA